MAFVPSSGILIGRLGSLRAKEGMRWRELRGMGLRRGNEGWRASRIAARKKYEHGILTPRKNIERKNRQTSPRTGENRL